MRVFSVLAEDLQNSSQFNWLSIAELENTVAAQGRSIQSFRVQGVVCAVLAERRMVVLQDETGSVLIELPTVDTAVGAGDWLTIQGEQCLLERTRYGIKAGSVLIVDNDGDHRAITKSGSAFLAEGMQPIKVEWYNSRAPYALKVEYEGPAIQRQRIPATSLWHEERAKADQTNYAAGVHFAAFVGKDWNSLPDFRQLTPIAEGIATNFSLQYRAAEDDTALVFSGYLKIQATGRYTFYLESDDGSRLSIGEAGARCQMKRLGRRNNPLIGSLAEAAPNHAQWVSLEGEVTFCGNEQGSLQLELAGRGNLVQATILEPGTLLSSNLLHRQIRVIGISEGARQKEPRLIWTLVPGVKQVEFPRSEPQTTGPELTTAAQIRRLKPDEANKPCHAILRGVVTWRSPYAIVLQDDSGGVFVHLISNDPADQPLVGDLWQIEGTTDKGDWSPVVRAQKAVFLGHGALPEPFHPTWDQLMNGSLDAQYIELRGVVCSATSQEMTILTQGGKVRILSNDERPLPGAPAPGTDMSPYLGSLVRMRGCLTAEIDWNTKRTKTGEIYLSPATISVEEPRPHDPFLLPLRRTSDMLLFDAGANALQRTKVAGQVIHISQGEFFILDGQTGLRVMAEARPSLRVGDFVEAVGFPKFGGRSPVIREAEVRTSGHAALPAAISVPADGLLDHNRDSTLVRIEAVLLGDNVERGERILELQTGAHHFLARLNSNPQAWAKLSPGSRLQLTGVYASAIEPPTSSNLDAFELLLNNPAGIVVLQQPPWWTVRRAIGVAAMLAGALGLAFVWITLLRRKVEQRTAQLKTEIEARQKLEQHRAMEQERIRVAQDLHDELGAGLTEMGILSTLAKNPAVTLEERENYLQQLTDSSRSLVTGLDEIVWAINPQYDSIGSLATYYSLFAQRFLNLAGIACRLTIPNSFPERPLDSRVRHGVFLAFKEALNNIVRHSGANEVELKIQVTDAGLWLSIRDNGRGLGSATETPGSDGLAGMRKRLHDLGGDCLISSSKGQGTTVEFRLALNGNSHD
jgi:signal transduction histidine kinase